MTKKRTSWYLVQDKIGTSRPKNLVQVGFWDELTGPHAITLNWFIKVTALNQYTNILYYIYIVYTLHSCGTTLSTTATTCEAERAISMLRRIHTNLRNSQTQQRLYHFSVLAAHRNVARMLDVSRNINAFIHSTTQRVKIFGHTNSRQLNLLIFSFSNLTIFY